MKILSHHNYRTYITRVLQDPVEMDDYAHILDSHFEKLYPKAMNVHRDEIDVVVAQTDDGFETHLGADYRFTFVLSGPDTKVKW